MEVTIKITIISAIAAIVVALIKLLGDLIGKGSSRSLIFAVIIVVLGLLGTGIFILFLPASPATTQTTTALSDKFDSSTGSYDTNLWACDNDCGIENLFVREGVLGLNRQNRSNEEITNIISRNKWNYLDLVSLQGKFQISGGTKHDELVWLGLHHETGCGFHAAETPFIRCNAEEYNTNDLPIKFDTWYSIKIEFGQDTGATRFYLDNTLMGEYTRTAYPGKVQVSTGIWSPDTTKPGQIYIDDILLIVGK